MALADHIDAVAAAIGPWLQRTRKAAGLTQEQAAERSGVKLDVVAKAEQGRNVRASNLVALLLTYDADIRTIHVADPAAGGAGYIDLMARLRESLLEQKKARRVAERSPDSEYQPKRSASAAKKGGPKRRAG